MTEGTSSGSSNPLAALGAGARNAIEAAQAASILHSMQDPATYAKKKPEDILKDLQTLEHAALHNPMVQGAVGTQLKALLNKFNLPGAEQAEAFGKQVQEVLKNETVQNMIKAVAGPVEQAAAAAIGSPVARIGLEVAGGLRSVFTNVQNPLGGQNTMFNPGTGGGGGPAQGTGGPGGGTPS